MKIPTARSLAMKASRAKHEAAADRRTAIRAGLVAGGMVAYFVGSWLISLAYPGNWFGAGGQELAIEVQSQVQPATTAQLVSVTPIGCPAFTRYVCSDPVISDRSIAPTAISFQTPDGSVRNEIVPFYFESTGPQIDIIRLSNGMYHLKRTPLTALRGFLRQPMVIYPVIVLVFTLCVLAVSVVARSWLGLGLAVFGLLLVTQAFMSYYVYERPNGMAGAKLAGVLLIISLIIIGLKILYDRVVAKGQGSRPASR